MKGLIGQLERFAGIAPVKEKSARGKK